MFLFLCLQMCNEWAIDTPCPAGGRDFCRSLHILDSRGNSVLASILFFFFPLGYFIGVTSSEETLAVLSLSPIFINFKYIVEQLKVRDTYVFMCVFFFYREP